MVLAWTNRVVKLFLFSLGRIIRPLRVAGLSALSGVSEKSAKAGLSALGKGPDYPALAVVLTHTGPG